MDTKTKIFLGVILICILSAMAYIIKVQRDTIASIQQNTTEQRFLKDNITAVQASLLTKDEFNKRLEQVNMDMNAIKGDLSKTNSTVTSILKITSSTPGYDNNNISSTGFIPRPQATTDPGNPNPPIPSGTASNGEPCYTDKYGYYAKLPYLNLTEPTLDNKLIPFGQTTFDVTKKDPWGLKVYPRDYSTTVLLATDPTGRKTAYAKMSIKPQDGSGKVYDLPQTKVEFVEQLPEPRIYWWNPRVMLGLDVGYSTKPGASYGPTAQVFVASYGKLKQVSDWHILGVGLNYDINNSKYNIAVSPFMWKVTGDNSIFQNLYVGPTIAVGFNGNVAALGGIRLSL